MAASGGYAFDARDVGGAELAGETAISVCVDGGHALTVGSGTHESGLTVAEARHAAATSACEYGGSGSEGGSEPDSAHEDEISYVATISTFGSLE